MRSFVCAGGDKLVIQFGRHDAEKDPALSTAARVTYPQYLGMYIDAARRQGAEPVLAVLEGDAGEYAAALRDLAEYRGVRMISLMVNPEEDTLDARVRRPARRWHSLAENRVNFAQKGFRPFHFPWKYGILFWNAYF